MPAAPSWSFHRGASGHENRSTSPASAGNVLDHPSRTIIRPAPAPVNAKDSLRHIESDGGSGFWAQSWDAVLLHYVGGKVTARIKAPGTGTGAGEGQVSSLLRIPGTRSLWATGAVRNRENWDTGVIWKYGA
ncbi:hypothetical protein [Actinomadura sp. 6N118]|uniref:hypothetical protein n=1 Tax=Actinomadura sp. 6N118 TaxID=3375151 RepID=UPI0037970DFF